MTPWAYSTFLEAIENGEVEKVSFSADGKQALSIDRDGNRHESLILKEQTAELVKLLTKKGVVFAVQSPAEAGAGSGALGGVLANLAFPLLIIGGLIFLQRRSNGDGDSSSGGGGPFGGGFNPMNIGKSKSKIQMEPETGVAFEDVRGPARTYMRMRPCFTPEAQLPRRRSRPRRLPSSCGVGGGLLAHTPRPLPPHLPWKLSF